MSQLISVNKGTQTKIITGLTNVTAYTFTVKAVDTAENESGNETARATPFVPVSGITDLPATGTAGVSLPLSGTVEPSNATHQTIVWFVKQGAETTAADAEITNGVLSTTGAGIVKVAATITDGTAVGTSYIQEFSITINSLSAGQLAADLNAISPGSASASGQTVTLMADLTLTGTITVPSGVTLDLVSSHKSLALGNNAVLTVNGTVNAEASTPNGTSFISGNGKLLVDSSTGNPATIDGTGVIHLKSQGTILYIESGKGLTLSGVTLDGLMTTAAAAAAGITLPPGYEDDSNNNERLVMFDGTLTMQSGVIGYNAGGGVIFGGVFNMYGGEIKNNYIFEGSYPQGGGIYVGSGSVFTMYGGEIKGNKAGSQGGGVYVTAGDYGNGKFVMAGGTVYGSSAGSGLANTSGSSGASLYCPFANAYWGDGATSIPDKSNQNGTLHGGTPTGTVE
jgi:hypothetical protein